MMKFIAYWTTRNLCWAASHFYFRGVEINGRESIPKDGPVLYAPNHSGAFLDAVLIAIFTPTAVSYFTRGDIFVPPQKWFLEALNMIPVFRSKDGFRMAAQNDETFDTAVRTMVAGKPLMIFPEANHDYPYILRTLSKGTARVAMSTQLETDKPVYIVPVGINYFRRHAPRFKLIVNYGKPICMKDYLALHGEHKGKAYNKIRNEMTIGLKDQMVIPDLDDRYEDKAKVFTRKNEQLSFKDLRKAATDLGFESEKIHAYIKPFVLLLSIVNIVPILICKKICSLSKDPVFMGSLKYGVAALLCPIWYSLLFLLLGLIWSWKMAAIIVIGMIVTLIVTYDLKRLYTDTEHTYYTIWERPNVKK